MPRLLLIEDNQHIQRIYSERLRREGFEVIIADNGEQGLELARTGALDAILLDIMLPKLSGFDVLKQLHENTTISHPPVFMLSNKAWPDDVQHALSLGARQFFSKGSSALHDIVMQIRNDCGLKKVGVISRSAAAARPIVDALDHPRLLRGVSTFLENCVATERGLPEAIVLDARDPQDNSFIMLQRLKTTPATQAVPVIALTDKPQTLQRADGFVGTNQIATSFRPAVLKLVGLEELAPAATA
jgi:DNA-binding response OmpR family regulator